jgi:methionyl aminopeptidase
MSYKNIIKTESDYSDIRNATEISVNILRELRDNVKIGVAASEIDGVPGVVKPFPSNVCVNVNEVVLHGIPHSNIVFKSGDLVKVDFGVIHNGFYTDHCITIDLGDISSEEQRLVNTGKLCIDNAVQQAIVGNKVSDISKSLESVCNMAGFNFVKNYCGHGIGKALWLEPEVLSYTYKGQAEIPLIEGMCLCVENQVVLGKEDLVLDSDGWSLKTVDKSKGVMFEHMVIVRKSKPEILTLLD